MTKGFITTLVLFGITIVLITGSVIVFDKKITNNRILIDNIEPTIELGALRRIRLGQMAYWTTDLVPSASFTVDLGSATYPVDVGYFTRTSVSTEFTVGGTASISDNLKIGGVSVLTSVAGQDGIYSSDSLDFDEFLDAMNLDANLTVTSAGFNTIWDGLFTFKENVIVSRSSSLSLISNDTTNPCIIFKTTNTGHQLNLCLDESASHDHFVVSGNSSGMETGIQIVAKDGYQSELKLYSGITNNSQIIHGSADVLSINNNVANKDILINTTGTGIVQIDSVASISDGLTVGGVSILTASVSDSLTVGDLLHTDRLTVDTTALFNGEFILDHTAVIDGDHAFELNFDAAGYGTHAQEIIYTTGGIAVGQDEAAILISIDESLANGGDVFGLQVVGTEGSANLYGMEVGVLVNPIIQLSGTFEDMSSVSNNGTDNLAAFISTVTDVNMFVSDNDYVIIGDTNKFEEIEFLLETNSANPGIKPSCAYSVGVNDWTTFSPEDTTNGMRNNGVIVWNDSDIPTWATGEGTEYLIKIVRTQNNLGTPPEEDKVQIAAATEYKWDKNAVLSIATLTASGSADNYFAGRVGIKDTIPGYDLSVDGTASVSGASYFTGLATMGAINATGAVDFSGAFTAVDISVSGDLAIGADDALVLASESFGIWAIASVQYGLTDYWKSKANEAGTITQICGVATSGTSKVGEILICNGATCADTGSVDGSITFGTTDTCDDGSLTSASFGAGDYITASVSDGDDTGGTDGVNIQVWVVY